MERRKYPRVHGIFKFFYKPEFSGADEWLPGYISNLSLNGAFVRFPKTVPLGIKISMRMPLEFMGRGTTMCHLAATVARHAASNSQGESLMGISFSREVVDAENQKLTLSRYIREQQDKSKMGKTRMKVLADHSGRQKKISELVSKAMENGSDNKKKKGLLSKIFKKD